MNNDIIKQTLIESFETIKDSWSSKSDSIVNCIVEAEKCDGSLAMDMWCYIIDRYKPCLLDKDDYSIYNDMFIDSVFWTFHKKYDSYIFPDRLCRSILYHVSPHLAKNHNLIKLIFGDLINAGCSGRGPTYSGKIIEVIPACIACLFLEDDARAISVLMKSLASNKKMFDIKLGTLFMKANYYLDEINMNKSSFNKDYCISDSVKDSLYNCLDLIKDKDDRAEIALSLMAR